MQVETLDYHTAGEPLRIVLNGLPEIHGQTMAQRRQYMGQELDAYRRFLMLEPRGHADMYGAVITPAATSDGDFGVLFMHNEGYSTMCGHGIIALVTAILEQGIMPLGDEQRIRIDTPAGRIEAEALRAPDEPERVQSVRFRNVPSFVMQPSLALEIDGHRIDCTIAYGGAFYAYVDAADFDLHLVPEQTGELVRLGRRIKQQAAACAVLDHPDGDAELNFLYGTVFVRPGRDALHSRNVCVFADGEVDRSPTGTGVSGRAAIAFARGDLQLQQTMIVESLIGTEFKVRCVDSVKLGPISAVVPEVEGSAYLCGRSRFELDPTDPLQAGFLIR